MPKFAANLTMMFNEVPFPQRFAAAAEAGFLESALMRVRVAVAAGGGGESLEDRWFALPWVMTLGARDNGVESGERETCGGVVKAAGGLPGVLVVALQAIRR